MSERVIVIHMETSVRVGSFATPLDAQNWIDQLRVNIDYKLRCYKIINEVKYWQEWQRGTR